MYYCSARSYGVEHKEEFRREVNAKLWCDMMRKEGYTVNMVKN